jgi:hypothetical protein
VYRVSRLVLQGDRRASEAERAHAAQQHAKARVERARALQVAKGVLEHQQSIALAGQLPHGPRLLGRQPLERWKWGGRRRTRNGRG